MIRNENGLLAGYVYVDIAGTDVGGYVERARRAVDAQLASRPGYTLEWSGQYENMLRVRERLKLVVPLTIADHLRAALPEHALVREDRDRAAGGALLRGRRGLADVRARLQRLDRGLGRA